jgi:hypothetical protein
MGMTLGMLIRSNAAAQREAPAAKVGELASSDMAEPETTSASPAMKTKKPAAIKSWPRRIK